MTLHVSLTEARNALRCPRLFALGRAEQRALTLPVVPSPLSAAFQRIVAAFAGSAPSSRAFTRFADMSDEPAVASAIVDGLLAQAVAFIDRHPISASMPAEIDDLSEALRQLAHYLARELKLWGGAPAPALAAFLESRGRTLDATIDTGREPVVVHGALDALEAPGTGALTVIEYKLHGSDALDRAQVALYRRVLRDSKIDSSPVVLRFQPLPAVTLLADLECDAIEREVVVPLIEELPRWARDHASAPGPSDGALCSHCPLRAPCRALYPTPLPCRDRAPATAARPLPDVSGELLLPPIAEAPPAPEDDDALGQEQAEQLRAAIEQSYRERDVSVRVGEVKVGPRLLSFEILAKRGSLRQVDAHAGAVSAALSAAHGTAASHARVLGSRYLEVVRRAPRPVTLDPLLARAETFLRERPGRFVLGEDLHGNVLRGDLAEPSSCHLLVGGAQGSGKTELLKTLLASLMHFYGPESIRFTLIDLAGGAFAPASAPLLAHLTRPVCTEVGSAMFLINALYDTLEERYRMFERAGVEDIEAYNEARMGPPLAREVVLVDSYAPLVASRALRESLLSAVQRIAGRARAVGIHLVLATDRVDTTTVPPLLKANLVGRVALRLPDVPSSRLLIGQAGAERLLGDGDLYADFGAGPARAQAARVEGEL